MRIWILLTVSFLLLSGCKSEPEPSYDGIKLSAWIDQLYDGTEDEKLEALDVIDEMGEEAKGVDVHLYKFAGGHVKGMKITSPVRTRAAEVLESRKFSSENMMDGLYGDLEGDTSSEARQDRKTLDNLQKIDPLQRKDFRSLEDN